MYKIIIQVIMLLVAYRFHYRSRINKILCAQLIAYQKIQRIRGERVIPPKDTFTPEEFILYKITRRRKVTFYIIGFFLGTASLTAFAYALYPDESIYLKLGAGVVAYSLTAALISGIFVTVAYKRYLDEG